MTSASISASSSLTRKKIFCFPAIYRLYGGSERDLRGLIFGLSEDSIERLVRIKKRYSPLVETYQTTIVTYNILIRDIADNEINYIFISITIDG